MFTLFITCYVVPMVFVLIYGLLADSQEATLSIAIPLSIMPFVNLVAAISCIGVTIRTTMDWISR